MNIERIVRDSSNTDPGQFYLLLTASIVPRPIAWVSSRSAAGVDNVAPYSFFSVASTAPPIISFTSVGGAKNSAANAIETGEFVVNVVTESLTRKANASSAGFDSDRDEFVEADIASVPAETVNCLRVRDSPVALECRLHRHLEVGNCVVVMGEVVAVTLDASVVAEDGLPDFARLAPMSRLGRQEWGLPSRTIEIDRPT
ncbi:flavin reductase family protein [Williamsia sp. CHRR-6]|uniref:flavin reductase family protein n=1 Tax=Williamsia sp. CHRR-6 TaxID=2835871 RepID=UPI001BD9F415|nr:flavin reductase family protein [Williamsia sp. CHRR-6]MBT0566220.1 flavin reductase family protein [Williamsia sp. CHRR-6]